MLRGGTAPLMIESGRWRGLLREERRCRECQLEKIEDALHCWSVMHGAQNDKLSCSTGGKCFLGDDDKLICVWDKACQHVSVL